jgi:UrcA family protein
MSRTFKIAIAAFAASMILSPVATAQVAGKPVSVSISVPYGDLDMSKPSSGATLLKRIEGAARKACKGSRSLIAPHVEAQCWRDAVGTAVRQADIGTLTLTWSGKSPSTNIAAR